MSEDWLDTGNHTRCPQCKSLKVQVRLVSSLELVPGTLRENRFGLRAAATESVTWIYRCKDCLGTGPAEMKTKE